MKNNHEGYLEKLHLLREKDGYNYIHSLNNLFMPRYTMNPSNAKRFKDSNEAQKFLDEIGNKAAFELVPVYEEIRLID